MYRLFNAILLLLLLLFLMLYILDIFAHIQLKLLTFLFVSGIYGDAVGVLICLLYITSN